MADGSFSDFLAESERGIEFAMRGFAYLERIAVMPQLSSEIFESCANSESTYSIHVKYADSGSTTNGKSDAGLSGKCQAINPKEEEMFWRAKFRSRQYVNADSSFETFHRAYQLGWEFSLRFPDLYFHEVEDELRQDWFKTPDSAHLDWMIAKLAMRDAWEHTDKSVIN